MVAKTPIKQRKIAALLNPNSIRDTVNKVDKCMARLQEIHFTIEGGGQMKKAAGVNLSPRSTRNYRNISLRFKQEHLRIKNATPKKSQVAKFQGSTTGGEWRRMSLPAMFVNETVGEIRHASQFARDVVASITTTEEDGHKTPATQRKKQRPAAEFETSELINARRKREKQVTLQSIRTESNNTPTLKRAKSRINFKISPPLKKPEFAANRVSPKHKPWIRKTVLFPNPLFIPSSNSTSITRQQRFCKTGSPVITKNKQTPYELLLEYSPSSVSKFQVKNKIKTPPHKFLIKSPPSASNSQPRKIKTPHKFLIKSPNSVSKFQVKIKNSSPVMESSPPPTKVKKLVIKKLSPKPKMMATYAKMYRSFSPSRIASRLLSPLRSRKVVQKSDGMFLSGLKQRPPCTPVKISFRRI